MITNGAADYQLAAIEVGGKEFAVLSFIESIF